MKTLDSLPSTRKRKKLENKKEKEKTGQEEKLASSATHCDPSQISCFWIVRHNTVLGAGQDH